MMEYTVEVYKKDARTKAGERLVDKVDLTCHLLSVLEFNCDVKYPASKGYRYEIHETYVTRNNMMSGAKYYERYDTPRYCSPSSEAYWSM
jgi:hypothetical protein